MSLRVGGNASLLRLSSGLAALGIIGLALGAAVSPEQLFLAYLTAFTFAITIALGALVFLMTCNAMRAKWPVALRRLVEAMVATLPTLGVLFLPLLLGLRSLYPWLRLDSLADEEARALVRHKLPYLNVPFFVLRAAIYFVIWIVVAELLRRWSLRSDAGREAVAADKMQALSAGALPPVGLAMSFASFDWLMSLTPTWSSTMFPVYFFAGGFVSAIAVLTVLTSALDRAGLLPDISSSHYYALGRLLLAFTIFWAYAAFFQLLLIWIGDRPDEVVYYAARTQGPWRALTLVLILAQFVVPFLALLNYELKRRRGPLTVVSVWLIAAHYLDAHWLVAPSGRPAGAPYHWLDFAALLAVGGLTVACGVWRLRGHAMMPTGDPDLAEALRYESA